MTQLQCLWVASYLGALVSVAMPRDQVTHKCFALKTWLTRTGCVQDRINADEFHMCAIEFPSALNFTDVYKNFSHLWGSWCKWTGRLVCCSFLPRLPTQALSSLALPHDIAHISAPMLGWERTTLLLTPDDGTEFQSVWRPCWHDVDSF